MDNGASSYRRFLEGDNQGLADLIEIYRIPLQMFLLSVTGNQDTAEEAAIETFVKLATKKPGYNGKASFRTWIFAIGRNTALDILRKTSKQKTVSFENIDESVTDDTTPEELYIKEERGRKLLSSMKKLKGEYYTALWLKYFENLQIKEIACILRKSESNTKVILSRAREALKIQLGKDGFEYEDK